jgi:hypothetical protein
VGELEGETGLFMRRWLKKDNLENGSEKISTSAGLLRRRDTQHDTVSLVT